MVVEDMQLVGGAGIVLSKSLVTMLERTFDQCLLTVRGVSQPPKLWARYEALSLVCQLQSMHACVLRQLTPLQLWQNDVNYVPPAVGHLFVWTFHNATVPMSTWCVGIPQADQLA